MKKDAKILLIEDNEGDAELTKEALKKHSEYLEITVITNGEEAIQYLKLNHEILPQLVFLDINLPKVDGKEVLHFIKNNDKLKKIPVVMLTSSALQNDINYAYNNHVNCYIVKSGNLKDFMDTINSIERFWMHCVTYPKTG